MNIDEFRDKLIQDKIDYYVKMPHPVEVIQDGDGLFACIPVLDGCMTQADTWEELGEMIMEAKRLWVEAVAEECEHIPDAYKVDIPEDDEVLVRNCEVLAAQSQKNCLEHPSCPISYYMLIDRFKELLQENALLKKVAYERIKKTEG